MNAALTPRWEARAACHRADPRLWSDNDPRGKDICIIRCPVLAQCLTHALRTEDPDARPDTTHGGLTAAERADLADDQALIGGQWDADEARLIALESADTGTRVQVIALREGASRLTERLASRMLARRLTPAAVIAGRCLAAERGDDIRAMVRRGTGIPKMADRLEVPETVVCTALEVLGLVTRTPVPGGRVEPSLYQLMEERDRLLALRDRGASIQDCADSLGYSYYVVKRALKKLREEEAAAVAAGMELAS